MLNAIWLGVIGVSFVVSIFTGRLELLAEAFQKSILTAVDVAIKIFGPMAFWLGIMQIAEDSGLVQSFTKGIRPVVRYLFPEVPNGHEAENAISVNFIANFLGISNAATPSGIRAMHGLQKLNPHPEYASDSMCMLIAINSSSIQLLPVTSMGFLVARGAKNSSDIVLMSILATIISTLFAIALCRFFKSRSFYPIVDKGVQDVNC